ncbi:MAG: 2-oxo acid dehydrogenase subunit E2, partial [Caldilineaceae bacterium]|nr:2-oxo acid dehydrogenase subunit E2 [Caldilineaceae bacterium]
MHEFKMPSLGADMESGILIAWEVKPGDEVERGDIIATVGTEKGDIAAEVFVDGVLDTVLVEEGSEVPVGTVLALIRTEKDERIPVAEGPPVPVAEAVPAAPKTNGKPPKVSAPATEQKAPAERVRMSPLARKVAEELGVDLSSVHGSGPHGAISRSDVEEAAKLAQTAPVPAKAGAPSPPVKAPKTAPPTRPAADFQTGMRRAIARAMSRANQDIPHYYLETKVDVTPTLAWLEAENMRRPIEKRLLPAVLWIKAIANALADVPELNGFWIDDQLQVQEAIHIGFAIALRQGGLITPAIHHADLKDLDELMDALRDLIIRTRENRLRSSELTDATVTVTNLGDLGV